MPNLSSTVRLQFHKDFTLDDALPLVSYFKQLGISHIYASPLLKARAGSLHGYDVVDPSCINPELGGEPALQRLVAELRKHSMGLIVDTVANHMAVGGSDNPWWMDVLAWGMKSPYARFFDIQWNSPDPLLQQQLLLPYLAAGYGETLASGEISLQFNAELGLFYVGYFEHWFPLYPPSYGHILGKTGDESLLILGKNFEALEGNEKPRHMAKELQQQLTKAAKNSKLANCIAHALSFYDVAKGRQAAEESQSENSIHEKASRDAHAGDIYPEWKDNDHLQRLHDLLELQHYRLAGWNTAADDINWRRFFDVNELAGIRVERRDVFEASHAKIFELIAKGLIDGLRIDHIDGLANPRSYCRKLRRRLNSLQRKRPGDLANDHLLIYVEKILGSGESLSQDWDVDGTTGYEFMNQISLLQHDPRGELQLYDLWSRISGRQGRFKDEAREARRFILSSSLAGDLERVAQAILEIARSDIATRDFTLGAIRRTLVELIVHFPVYRTYANACGRSAQDQLFFDEALVGARTTLSEIDWPLLSYIDRWLGGQSLRELPPSTTRKLRKKLLSRFQQLTSPAAAKAVEDTACYRSAVLLSRNDVGFDPQYFSAPLLEFHQKNSTRSNSFPHNLLATATHDHKRGEDTRARLAAISERAAWFSEKVDYWQSLAGSLRSQIEGDIAPSAGDELILYQILLGSWPLQLSLDDKPALDIYLERILRWQEKALREAKLRTSWTAPNVDYETACRHFTTGLFTANESQALRADIAQAAQSLAAAGALNSLSQTLLKMTLPGVPDIYQGTEFWDFSLVDPDNRQPVDFARRRHALKLDAQPDQLVQDWQSGAIKQWLIARTLALRNRHPELFSRGDYQPLEVIGEHRESVVAFIRKDKDNFLLVIIPRLAASLLADSSTPHVPFGTWGNTQVVLPSTLGNVKFKSYLSETAIVAHQARLEVQQVLANFPVNILFFNLSTLSTESA
ncbi:MAG TPA: malto-oligosyltrehalose synthase [Cellvibrio sp.]|nr:malto-oligosyltrehalose synthase [Cellvibrio sp.]